MNAARYGAVVMGAGPAGEVAANQDADLCPATHRRAVPTFTEAYLKGVESLEL